MMLETNFTNEKFLITGATGGIGAALAKKLLQQGAKIVLHGRDEHKLSHLACKLDATNTDYIVGDLCDLNDIRHIAKRARQQGITGLINCAGTNQFSTFEAADIETTITTNITGTLLLCQALLGHLKKLDSSWLVNIGSTFGSIGYPGYVCYCASKHAIKGFSEALKRELAGTGVKVLYISPRATATDMNSKIVNQLNHETGVNTDQVDDVANSIARAMCNNISRSQFGWPEKLQTRINAIFPSVVDAAINKQLPVINKYLSKQ